MTLTAEKTEEPTVTEDPKEPVKEDVEKNAAPTPLTVAKTAEKPVNEFGYPDDTSVSEMTFEQQAAYWKRMSRKHESREKEAKNPDEELRSQVNELRANLAARDLSDAMKDVRIAHPELDDEAMSLCDKTDPDEVRKWGDTFSKFLSGHGVKPDDIPDADGKHPLSRVEKLSQLSGSGAPSHSTPAKGSSNRKSNYEASKHRYDETSNK